MAGFVKNFGKLVVLYSLEEYRIVILNPHHNFVVLGMVLEHHVPPQI